MFKGLAQGLSSFGSAFKANMQDDVKRRQKLAPFMSPEMQGLTQMVRPLQEGPPPIAPVLPTNAPPVFNIEDEDARTKALYLRQLREGLAKGPGYSKY